MDLRPKDGVERIIKPKQYAKYLGIILDLKLNSIKYMEYVKERVEKSI
jgi:hypothetical protein